MGWTLGLRSSHASSRGTASTKIVLSLRLSSSKRGSSSSFPKFSGKANGQRRPFSKKRDPSSPPLRQLYIYTERGRYLRLGDISCLSLWLRAPRQTTIVISATWCHRRYGLRCSTSWMRSFAPFSRALMKQQRFAVRVPKLPPRPLACGRSSA